MFAVETAVGEQEAVLGVVQLAGVALSEVELWRDESGDYVIRSVEFDVLAGDPRLEVATEAFIDHLESYATLASEAVRATDGAPREVDSARSQSSVG